MDPSEKQAAKYKSKNMMGYIQDKVDVGMAKLRSDEGVALDVAVVKATLQDEVVPKEKHVRTLLVACSGSAPRQQVNYVIHGLGKRLEDKAGWLVTLKTLIVFHRLMREVDPSFQEEIVRYQERTGAHRMLRLEGFADHTTKDTWDYSAWIRVYSVYLDERLGVFKAMRFDPEAEADGGRDSKLKSCAAPELLEKLPLIHKLLNRLVGCVPEGSAQRNEIVLQSCAMVLREVRAIYRTACEGVINLADKFFEMERTDALKGLDIYRENSVLNEKLNAFFGSINNVPALRGAVQFPSLQSLPSDFLTTMEEYVRDAPKTLDPSASGRRPGATPASAGATGGATAAAAAPPAATRSSTLARQGGTTSSALAGNTGGMQVLPAPAQGVLKIGPPMGSAPAPSAKEVDLLGDDFTSAVAVSQPAPAPAQPQPPQQHAPQQHAPYPGAPPPQQQWQQPPGVPQQQQPGPYGYAPAPGYGVPPPGPPGYGPSASFPAPAGMPPPQPGYGPSASFPAPAAAYQAPPPVGIPQGYGSPAHMPTPSPQPQAAPAPAAGGWGDNAFGAPAFPPQAQQPPQQQYGAPQHGAYHTAPHAAAQQQPQQQAPAAFGFDDQPAFGAPAGGAPAHNPFGGPAPAAQPYAQQPAAQPYAQQPAVHHQAAALHHAPPPAQPANPFGANPFGGPAPGAGAPAPVNPFGGPAPYQQQPGSAGAPGANPFGGPQPSAGGYGANPFGGQVAPQGVATWGANLAAQRKAQDPLGDLDLFGKPAPAPPPALRDMRQA